MTHPTVSNCFRGHPLARPVGRGALVASILVFALASAGATVRLLPWLLDPSVPLGVLAPFIRGLLTVVSEATFLLGVPLGSAYACHGALGRGEILALQCLGQRPIGIAAGLLPVLLVFSGLLAASSAALGRDATTPGHVAADLLQGARTACASAHEPRAYAVPVVEATWLCVPGASPRLVLRGPGPLRDVVVTATGVSLASDLRTLTLDDARTSLVGGPGPGASLDLHVGRLEVRGLAPWGRAATLMPGERAMLLGSACLAAALAAALGVLLVGRRRGAGGASVARGGTVSALFLGAVGPLAVLGGLRVLELRNAPRGAFLLLLPAGPLACLLGGLAVAYLVPSLLRSRRAASKRRGTSAPLA